MVVTGGKTTSPWAFGRGGGGLRPVGDHGIEDLAEIGSEAGTWQGRQPPDGDPEGSGTRRRSGARGGSAT